MENSNSQLQFQFITDYLKSRQITNSLDKNISHTSLGDKKLNIYPGKYFVKSEEKDYFLNLYCNWIFKYEHNLHLTEKHNPEKCPILIDLDFRYENTGSMERIYSEEDIVIFIKKYFEILESYLNIEIKQKETFILEKPTPVQDIKNPEIMKDGVHIIMPYIVTNYNGKYSTMKL